MPTTIIITSFTSTNCLILTTHHSADEAMETERLSNLPKSHSE